MQLTPSFHALLPLVVATLVAPSSIGAQQSKALFDAAVVVLDDFDEFSSPPTIPFRRLLDVDGDGDLDALGMAPENTGSDVGMVVYRNDGGGSLPEFSRWVWEILVPTSELTTFHVETGDLNGDGRDDFTVSFENQTVRADGAKTPWYRKRSGTWRTLSGTVSAVAHPDLDQDGRDDSVFCLTTTFEVENSATGSVSSFLHGGLSPTVVRALDVDGDSDLDLAFCDASKVWFAYADQGAYSVAAGWAHGLTDPMFDIGDVDGDGDVDGMLFEGTGVYRTLRQTAATWDLEGEVIGGPAEFLTDVDGDGDLDGVCCGGGGGTQPGYPTPNQRSDFQIALNDGTGRLAKAFRISGVGSPQLAGAADIDGDGDVDLVAGRCVYYGRGGALPLSSRPGYRAPAVSGPRSVNDIDGDGDMDLGPYLGTVEMNDGQGIFSARALPAPPAPEGTLFVGPGYPGDFDGDGDVDLLVEHRLGTGKLGSASGFGHARPDIVGMRLLRNDGAGRFLDGGAAGRLGVTFSSGSLEPEASLVVDLDGDGDLDLVTRSMSYPAMSKLWINTGAGWFAGPLANWFSGPVNRRYRLEAILDLDGDGVVDAVASRKERSPWGNGDFERPEVLKGYAGTSNLPTFVEFLGLTPEESLGFNSVQNPLTVGDLTGDGFADILTHDVLTDQQGLGGRGYYREDGAIQRLGWWQAFGERMLLGDLDGDGTDDLTIGSAENPYSRALAQFQIKTPGTWLDFDAPFLQSMIATVLVDVDGDGDLDAIGRDVVLNTSVP